jgi:hypothetical protein
MKIAPLIKAIEQFNEQMVESGKSIACSTAFLNRLI